ncbi:hydroxymethylglutaryl-CoA lyase [Castellaniella sp. MT123]|uniref:hydroxymethylglutaryl-CoA lyase n=1 Tax=Castellaniella sp. MT123 TaxID=3140381 RepID=UPI0031F3F75A
MKQQPSAKSPVVICECFCRDGLQHEPTILDTATKVQLVDRLSAIGFGRIEVTSYSNPAVIAQFADASDVLRDIQRKSGVYYKATCANLRAVERAVSDLEKGYGANEISVLVSASESHSQKNLKRSRADQWDNVRNMVALANGRFRVIGTISVAFGCPFEGQVAVGQVLDDIRKFRALGVEYITLGDTTGMATPETTKYLFLEMARAVPDVTPIAHFHDSRGTALLNYVAAYEAGVRYFDSAMGGVGGHPHQVKYGGGYTGNACTEDLVGIFESMGIPTGVDKDGLLQVSAHCEDVLGRQLHSHVTRTGWNPLVNP